jgi:hypothetical protein
MNNILRFDTAGHLVMDETPPEPICVECDKPIRWVLDMVSFDRTESGDGRFALAHAHCVWLPDAFSRERKIAKRIENQGATGG